MSEDRSKLRWAIQAPRGRLAGGRRSLSVALVVGSEPDMVTSEARNFASAQSSRERWLVETRVRCSHATMAAAQRARCRSRLVFLPLRAAASWRRQPGRYSFSLRWIVSTQQWWPWLHTRSHEQRKRPEGDLQEASEVSQWRWRLAWGLAWSPARPGAGERPEGDLQKPRVSSMNDYGWLGA